VGTGFILTTMATSEIRHKYKYMSWKWDKIAQEELHKIETMILKYKQF
jgi:hypothetical protein